MVDWREERARERETRKLNFVALSFSFEQAGTNVALDLDDRPMPKIM